MEIQGSTAYYAQKDDMSFGSKAYRAYHLGRKGLRRVSDKAARLRQSYTEKAYQAELDRRSAEAALEARTGTLDHFLAELDSLILPQRKQPIPIETMDKPWNYLAKGA